MRSDDGAVHKVQRPAELSRLVGLLLQRTQDLVPDARPSPAIESRGDRLPLAVATRQVAPQSAGAQDPQDAIDDPTVRQIGSPPSSFLRRKQTLELLPLCFVEFSTSHPPRNKHAETLRKHALVQMGLAERADMRASEPPRRQNPSTPSQLRERVASPHVPLAEASPLPRREPVGTLPSTRPTANATIQAHSTPSAASPISPRREREPSRPPRSTPSAQPLQQFAATSQPVYVLPQPAGAISTAPAEQPRPLQP